MGSDPSGCDQRSPVVDRRLSMIQQLFYSLIELLIPMGLEILVLVMIALLTVL